MATVVGIDIGHQTIKLAALEKRGKKWVLQGLSLVHITPGPWQADILKNTDEIAKMIREGMRQAKPHSINAKHAMFALPESVIFSGTFATPQLPMKELKEALPFEISDKLSINLEEYDIDYEKVTSSCRPIDTRSALPPATKKEKAALDTVKKDGKSANSGPAGEPLAATESPMVTIFAVAAKKTLISSIVELAAQANLNLDGIDIKPGAIARAAIPKDDGKARLIVDIGVGGTSASIAEGKSLRVTATIPWGLNSLGENVQGVVPDLAQKASPVFDEMIHISKFFENRICPGLAIEEVIIAGSGANIDNVVEVFQKETGLPTSLAQAFADIETGSFKVPASTQHTFADAIGLAMRDPNNN